MPNKILKNFEDALSCRKLGRWKMAEQATCTIRKCWSVTRQPCGWSLWVATSSSQVRSSQENCAGCLPQHSLILRAKCKEVRRGVERRIEGWKDLQTAKTQLFEDSLTLGLCQLMSGRIFSLPNRVPGCRFHLWGGHLICIQTKPGTEVVCLDLQVVGFRTIQGVQRDHHILGVIHKVSFWSFDARSWTGQSVMFWIDIFLLVLAMALIAKSPRLQQSPTYGYHSCLHILTYYVDHVSHHQGWFCHASKECSWLELTHSVRTTGPVQWQHHPITLELLASQNFSKLF